MEHSPVNTHLLKRHVRRIISSDEEEIDLHPRPTETTEREDTPCDSSGKSSCVSGHSLVEDSPVFQESPQEETVIDLISQDPSPWDSDVDGQESDTSTPAYKRGRYTPPRSEQEQKQEEDLAAVRLIQEEGINFHSPNWINRRAVAQSVVLLADSRVKNWPKNDKVVKVEYHPEWPIKRWAQAVKLGHIQLQHTTVIIYLEGTQFWEDVPPIKNTLHTLCKAVRHLGVNPRIFIANHIPLPRGSPLKAPEKVKASNFIQQQAIRSVARAMGRIFEISVFEHFVSSKKNKLLSPVGTYFMDDGMLTKHGCLVLRECLLREAGLKPYWFSGKKNRK